MKVILANEIRFDCQPDQTILDAARLQNIALEHSCRTGRCGVCKARVTSGNSVALKTEESLTKQEQDDGYILTCCRTAETQITLNVEDLGELGNVQVKTLPCRIDQIQKLSDDVIEITLRTPPTSKLEYLPGQYVDMIGSEGLRRSYSIANAPREDGKVSLQIRKVVDGLMSHYWFEEAKTNDLLRMEGPLGTFCLRKTNAKQLIMLATGTGIAPVKAILEQLASKPELNTFESIHVYWGGREAKDIYWRPDFPQLSIRFVPVLSHLSEWQGRNGYVQEVAIEDGHEWKASVVYACGSDKMIHSAHEQLTAAGLNDKDFYSDAFVSSN
ncbi:MAG: 2Fe-2S iron-sulfur cluster binding domain-containing protein [Pseudomonas sp.]|nr:2Fe-2S iron-sulfur cluster binding domain-containing protein [Pseudomonas sp.]